MLVAATGVVMIACAVIVIAFLLENSRLHREMAAMEQELQGLRTIVGGTAGQ